MTIVDEKLGSIYRAESAAATQRAFERIGLAPTRYIIGAAPSDAPVGFEAGAECRKDGCISFWLLYAERSVEYLEQLPSTDFSAVAIPFFLSDFALTIGEFLDMHARLGLVRQRLASHSIALSVVRDGDSPNAEGYCLKVLNKGIFEVHYLEKDTKRKLARTLYPWAAALYVTWLSDYKNLDYR